MIEETRIKENLNTFAFPRLSGTIYELEAFNKLMQKVEDLNLEFEVQPFTFSSFYSRLYPKIAFLCVSLILLLLYLNIYLISSVILTLILLGIVISVVLFTRKPEKIQSMTKFNSQNLIVKIKSNSNETKNDDRIALFVSHLDSKGQRFKIKIRIRVIKLWIASSGILFSIVILKNLIFMSYAILFYIIGLIPLTSNMISSILMVLNTTDNRSIGAIDNASGIACNLELLHYYSIPKNRLHNYSMWFLFTGAEECGTMGVRHFYNNLEKFDPEKSIIFNFESIGKYLFIFPGENEGDHSKDIDNLLLNNKRNLPIRHYFTERVLGTHSDGGFLGDRGLQGFEFGGVETYAYMHTPHDTVDKIDTKILEKLCLILTDALKEHDYNFFK
ncbi:MAG: M28 family peptidase [Promethearchaeota archaeon]